MLWTTIPSIVIALVLFTLMGLNIDSEAANTDLELTLRLISDNFTIHPIMLLPVLTLLVMANKRIPARPDHPDRRFTGSVTRTHFRDLRYSALARRKTSFWLISAESGKPCSMVSRSAATQLWMTS